MKVIKIKTIKIEYFILRNLILLNYWVFSVLFILELFSKDMKNMKKFWILSRGCITVFSYKIFSFEERINVAKHKNHCTLFHTLRAIAGNTLYASNISVKKNIPLHGDERRQPFTWRMLLRVTY